MGVQTVAREYEGGPDLLDPTVVGGVAVPAAPARAARATRQVPGWWREGVQVATVASVLVVVGLWLTGGNATRLGTAGDALVGAGRLTGLVSADLLLVQVLMMARIPLVERAYGQDELTRRHRVIGFVSFDLMVVHIVLVTLGEAAQGHTGAVAQFLDLVLHTPDVLLATGATALLTLVAVGSVRVARRRLRYETWHVIHLYAYLGVGLAIPHELSLGNDFAVSSLSRAYWWGLYVAALASVLVWRVGRPLWLTLRHRLVVEQVVPEGPDVVSVLLRGRRLDRMGAAAGQYFVWRFLSGPGWTRGHPFSLSAPPSPTRLRITVKDLGDDSGQLARLRPGTRVLVEGPYGRLHAGVRTRRQVTLIAAGIGITPIRALLEELDGAPGDLTLLYRASAGEELVFTAEIEQLAWERGIVVHYLLGRRRPSRRGGSCLPDRFGGASDPQVLRSLVPGLADQDVYLCGPQAWLDATRDAVLRVGVAPERVHLERFTW